MLLSCISLCPKACSHRSQCRVSKKSSATGSIGNYGKTEIHAGFHSKLYSVLPLWAIDNTGKNAWDHVASLHNHRHIQSCYFSCSDYDTTITSQTGTSTTYSPLKITQGLHKNSHPQLTSKSYSHLPTYWARDKRDKQMLLSFALCHPSTGT